MAVCLYCYGELTAGEKDFHKRCSQKMFGTPYPPELPYTRENLTDLARQVIRSQTTLTGYRQNCHSIFSRVDETRSTVLRLSGCGDGIF